MAKMAQRNSAEAALIVMQCSFLAWLIHFLSSSLVERPRKGLHLKMNG